MLKGPRVVVVQGALRCCPSLSSISGMSISNEDCFNTRKSTIKHAEEVVGGLDIDRNNIQCTEAKSHILQHLQSMQQV